MTTYKVSQDFDDTYRIRDRSLDTWLFTKSSTINTENVGLMESGGDRVKIILEGQIVSTLVFSAIVSTGLRTSITVQPGSDPTGFDVIGAIGITTTGKAAHIRLNGVAFGFEGEGISSSGADFRLETFGDGGAGGKTGVYSSGDNLHIVNGGSIVGSQYGIRLNHGMGDTTYTLNKQNLSYFPVSDPDSDVLDFVAFQGSSADDTLINRGRIQGIVDLGAGKDVLDARGGTFFKGEERIADITGGFGDDTFITDSANYVMKEIDGQGEDIVKSTVTYSLDPLYYIERLQLIGKKSIDATGTNRYEELWGNSGDNNLQGLDGGGELDGKAGNDRLFGGQGADFFVFASGYGRDTVIKFEQGLDRITIADWKAIKSFESVLSHADDHKNDVWIQAGRETLVIKGMNAEDLASSDFALL